MAVSFNLPDPYEAQKQEIARRQAYAQALQQQAFQPIETSSFQGFQAPIPATAVLAKALQGFGGGYLTGQAEREQRDLRQADIARGQEFAAALQGAKTPEERQNLATRALGGDFGARGQAMAGPVFTMAETAKEREAQRAFREAEAEKQRQATAADREANRQLRESIAANQRATTEMVAGARIDAMREAAATKAAEAERKSKEPTAQEQRQVFQVQDQIDAGQSTLSLLNQAKDLSGKFRGGAGAGAMAYLGSQARSLAGMPPSEESNALINYDNLVKEQALSQLKTTFGGNPTEGERKVLLELQASSGKTPEQRNDILDRAIKLAQDRIRSSEQRRESILTRQYRQPGAPAMAPAQPVAPTAPSAPTQQPRRLKFNPATGDFE